MIGIEDVVRLKSKITEVRSLMTEQPSA